MVEAEGSHCHCGIPPYPCPGQPRYGHASQAYQLDAPSQDLESCMSDNSTEMERSHGWPQLCLGVFAWWLITEFLKKLSCQTKLIGVLTETEVSS